MSPWKPKFWAGEEFPKTKQPAPEHGIKAGKLGESWWAKLWIDALERVLGADSGRLARGRAYARGGRAHDLSVANGKISARVTGSRVKPYRVTIQVSPLLDDAWQRVLHEMASKAQFSAELLAGQMPHALNDVFVAAGSQLFPSERSDLRTSCTCPDDGDPCKHVAATHYVLGEALDRDPFLLLELRGMKRSELLDALRALRGAGSSVPTPEARDTVKPQKLELPQASDYDAPRGALPSIDLSFDAPAKSGTLLRQLGVPSHWQRKGSPVDELTPLIRAAAERARSLALSESEAPLQPEPPVPPTVAKKPRKKAR